VGERFSVSRTCSPRPASIQREGGIITSYWRLLRNSFPFVWKLLTAELKRLLVPVDGVFFTGFTETKKDLAEMP
jgi:hypothetical protein